LPQNNILSDGI